jgi:peptide deformylase
MEKMSEIITFNTEKAVEHGLQQNLNQGPKAPTFKLVAETDLILKEVMPEFDFANAPVNPNEFASSMVETCIQNKGYGLSANQCGFRYRMFVMGAGDDYVAFFNPKVVMASEKQAHMMEGCLSYPFLGLMITRPETINVEYQDYNGERKTTSFSGISARCFLHELDHMNGVVYTSRVKPLALQSGMKKRNKVKQLIEKAKKAGALIEKATT